jgi:chemotaxis protein methyltransferase CheR
MQSSVEEIETDLLLEALCRRYGDDLRGHARSHLWSRLQIAMRGAGVATLSALQERALRDEAFAGELLRMLRVRPAGLFHDPLQISMLRQALRPWLRSCPVARIWISEFSCAEDVYTLAILLKEEGFYDKTLLFATAASETLLNDAKLGRMAAPDLARYQQNYLRSGGRASLSDYVEPDGDGLAFRPELGRNIIWAQYHLATDATFNEFQLIMCKGPLSEMAPAMRRRALGLFNDSLAVFGYLSLAPEDSLEALPETVNLTEVHRESGLYRRIA